jgi:hypothetical protein
MESLSSTPAARSVQELQMSPTDVKMSTDSRSDSRATTAVHSSMLASILVG